MIERASSDADPALVDALTLAVRELRDGAVAHRWVAKSQTVPEHEVTRRLKVADDADRAADVLLDHLRGLTNG